jgi:hypothetical protein
MAALRRGSPTLYAMNLWNRGFFDALHKRNTQHVLDLALPYFPLLAASVFLAVLCAHDGSAPMACVAKRSLGQSLAC